MGKHKIWTMKGGDPQRSFKIGIAIPCHVSDLSYLSYCLAGIKQLNPQPFVTCIDINENSDLGTVRKLLFQLLLEKGCDVIFQVSADFYLKPDILKHVDRKQVCSFNPYQKGRFMFPLMLCKVLFRNGWSGCYTIPREYWPIFQEKFNGKDSSIWHMVGRFNYKYTINPKWIALRPYRRSSVKRLLKTKPLWKRIIWQWMRLLPVRLN